MRTTDSLRSSLVEIDQLIRQSRIADARKAVERAARGKPPRRLLASVAQLSWRCGLPGLGLRLLHPVVRASDPDVTCPTGAESAEYAQCLTKVGATEESLAVLNRLDPTRVPQALFYQGAALVSRWNDSAAIPLFQKYLRTKGLGSYQVLVGKVNLAASLIAEREFRRATLLLRDILYETSVRRLRLLHGNALELSAASFVIQKDWRAADHCLTRAEGFLRNHEGLDGFFVRKWGALLSLGRERASPASLARVSEIRSEAERRRHWETIRDCDRFQAIASGDEALFLRLYFGTPYESFRRRLVREMGGHELPSAYLWRPFGERETGPVLDASLGGTAGARLKPGQVPFRLFRELVSDLYRPSRVATLYARVFPSEFYNPAASPGRIHQAVKALRHWLREQRLPLSITEEEGAYRLTAVGPCAIRLRDGREGEGRHDFRLRALRESWPAAAFSAEAAGRCLGLSARSALATLEHGIAQGWVVREGKRSGARYRFVAG